jgi:hypothetical protein
MVTGPTRIASFITDEDERLLFLLQADPQARQLLRCFSGLSIADRRVVSRVAHARSESRPHLVDAVIGRADAPLRLVSR